MVDRNLYYDSQSHLTRYGARRGTRVSIRSSARNESADTAGARRGTRVPIRSSARNVSADTELGGEGFGKKQERRHI